MFARQTCVASSSSICLSEPGGTSETFATVWNSVMIPPWLLQLVPERIDQLVLQVEDGVAVRCLQRLRAQERRDLLRVAADAGAQVELAFVQQALPAQRHHIVDRPRD